MNNISQLPTQSLRAVNRMLKKSEFEQFNAAQIKAIRDVFSVDVLGIRLLPMFIRGEMVGKSFLEHNEVLDDVEFSYAIVLKSCSEQSDILLLDADFNPLSIYEHAIIQ